MDENYAWNRFEQSGKITDYLKYTETKNEEMTISKVGENATQDTRDNLKTT